MNKNLIIISIIGFAAVGAFLVVQSNPDPREYESSEVEGLREAAATEIVELEDGDTYELTASYVKKNIQGVGYRMLAYNGSIPGPLLKIPQGAQVTINFKNDTDMKTLLHSHGIRMEHAFDGAQTSQRELAPGESFTYVLKFPDAGVYWYHPHVREDFEQELGLYGNYLVMPSNPNYWSAAGREIALFLDDILIENGKIELSKEEADRTLMGRYGNVQLVNGDTDYVLQAKKGEIVRLFVTNAANTRPFNFAIADVKMKLVGADNGAYEGEQWVENVLLGPSERIVVEVRFDKAGTFAIQNKTPEKTYTLGTVTVAGTANSSSNTFFDQLKTNIEVVRSIDPMRKYFNKVPDKTLTLTVDMGMRGVGHGSHVMSGSHMMNGAMDTRDGIEWEDTDPVMNEASNAASVAWKIVDKDSGKENMDIDWNFKKGEVVKIRIENITDSMHPMQHPIHFHGQRFLVIAREGVSETNLAWKDTVLIPSGGSVDILLDTSNPGTWMAHCHIAEHLEAGMMMNFKVE